MKKKIRSFIIVLFVIAFLLLIVGGTLSIKKLKNKSNYLYAPDNGNYYVAKINLNGASFTDTKTVRCQIDENGCYVLLPNVIREHGIVLGYSDNKDDTTAKYNQGSSIFISDNVELYVISYHENTLIIDDTNIDYLENNNISCKMYNEDKSCKVKLPRYNKKGYENKGYSTSKESLTGFIYPNDEYSISRDTVIYPIYSTSNRHRAISVDKVLDYNGSFIEIESGCDVSTYNTLLSYLDEIKQYTPYMLIGNKISFVSDNTFDEVWGSTYVGMNYGPKNSRSVDIRCSKTVYNDYYATMVHEMAHSWDFYYAKKLGDNISSQSDVINLYNKYKNEQDRIFREYSFSNIYEFIADMMRYYYFKNYAPRLPFKNLSYPFDVQNTLEKYICISKNNYSEINCR